MPTHSDSPLLTPSSPSHSSSSVYRVYPARFLILFTFSLISFNQSLFWLTFSPISDLAESYYNVSVNTVNLLLNWGPIIYIPCQFASFWISSIKGGLRKTVLLSSTTCTIAMCLRVVPNLLWHSDSEEFRSNAIWFLHVAHILNAAAGPLVMSTVSQCSCLWFGINERAKATSIAVFANNLGAAIGFLQMPSQVQTESQIPSLLYTHAGMAIFASILTLAYFPASPPSPPSHAAEIIMFPSSDSEASSSYSTSFKSLGNHFINCCKNPSFFILSMVGGGILGIFNAWSALFNNILGPIICGPVVDDTCDVSTIAGWIGFSATISAVIGGVIMGAIADTKRFRREFKLLILTGSALSFISFLYFLLCTSSPLFPDPPLSATTLTLAVAITMSGFALGLLNPLYYELSAELTYPVPEQYSAGILTLWNNGLGIIFIFAQPYFSAGFMNLMMMIAVILAGLLIFPVKEKYKRRDDDEQKGKLKLLNTNFSENEEGKGKINGNGNSHYQPNADQYSHDNNHNNYHHNHYHSNNDNYPSHNVTDGQKWSDSNYSNGSTD